MVSCIHTAGRSVRCSLGKFYNNVIIDLTCFSGGCRGLMVMALDCGAVGREFKPRRFQNIFDLMEWFDEMV